MRQFLGFVLLLSAILYSQDSNSDPEGWGGAKWGMTNEQILTVFGGRVKLLENMSRPGVGIKDLELEGRLYKLIFVPDKNGKLDWVSITPHQSKSQLRIGAIQYAPYPVEAFAELNTALIRKYGKPLSQTSEVLEGWKHVLVTWSFPTTSIELVMRTHTRFDGMNLIELRYKKRSVNPDL